MSEHLSAAMLTGLADGELTAEELARVNEHLAECRECTSGALAESLMKGATARAGRRYAMPAYLRDRVVRGTEHSPVEVRRRGWSTLGWVAALVLVSATIMLVGRPRNSADMALATEVADEHIATLAANAPMEVISTDRHTVKPWFQGRIPFSFNLPPALPADVTLDGANLTYLRGKPTAQLLYSIGKHRVSVFLQQDPGTPTANAAIADRSGFHVVEFRAGELDGVAVSDVEPARLLELVQMMEQVQGEPAK